MILIPIVALFVGLILGRLFAEPIRGDIGKYLAVACLAGLDTVCGGIRSSLEGKFHNDIFVTGFIANIFIAFFIAWLGDRIGVDLFLVATFILGGRIFTNLSLIRRFMLTKFQDAKERKQRLAQQQSNLS